MASSLEVGPGVVSMRSGSCAAAAAAGWSCRRCCSAADVVVGGGVLMVPRRIVAAPPAAPLPASPALVRTGARRRSIQVTLWELVPVVRSCLASSFRCPRVMCPSFTMTISPVGVRPALWSCCAVAVAMEEDALPKLEAGSGRSPMPRILVWVVGRIGYH